MSKGVRDSWASWLLPRRHVDTPSLYPQRDRILEAARIEPGDVVLDLGSGDGLLAFAALERVGERGVVIFCDASELLLEACRSRAERIGVLDRCRFVHARAEALSPVPDASVDAVISRAVLLYMEDKQRVFSELFRILRMGGRLSSCDRINSFGYPDPLGEFWGYDVTPVQEIAGKLKAYYDEATPTQANPMVNFGEEDLMRYAENSGFENIHLQLEAEISPLPPTAWDEWLAAVHPPPFPQVSLVDVMAATLTAEERQAFEGHVRPLVERGIGRLRKATAYLQAAKG